MSKDFFAVQDISYNFRNVNMLRQPMYKTLKHGFHLLRYQGAMLWNKIPDTVKALDFNGFKSYVLKWQPECQCGTCLLCTL